MVSTSDVVDEGLAVLELARGRAMDIVAVSSDEASDEGLSVV